MLPSWGLGAEWYTFLWFRRTRQGWLLSSRAREKQMFLNDITGTAVSLLDCDAKVPRLFEILAPHLPMGFSFSLQSSSVGSRLLAQVRRVVIACSDICLNSSSASCWTFEESDAYIPLSTTR